MELELIEQARRGDGRAFELLAEPLRAPLFRFIYRMVSLREDAEDLQQTALLRAFEAMPKFRAEAAFKTWLFGIAAHLCLDHLRARKRWRVEAQLIGEQEADADPATLAGLQSLAHNPAFRFEIKEHIAFCFSCLGRTLEPEQQAVLLLKEVLGFTAQEGARALEISEPVFRHRLSAARGKLASDYQGLCRLIDKQGVCYQCAGLREFLPEHARGEQLVHIEVAPGIAVTPESLLDARLAIVREADLEHGPTRTMHDLFFQGLAPQEENRTP
jgi:RNA polymerase sigma-70 factor (ECF subfamily)